MIYNKHNTGLHGEQGFIWGAEISMFPHSQLWVFCSTHAWQISSNGLIAFILG